MIVQQNLKWLSARVHASILRKQLKQLEKTAPMFQLPEYELSASIARERNCGYWAPFVSVKGKLLALGFATFITFPVRS